HRFIFNLIDKKIFLLGVVQALFEASMYVFVLEWTPALTQASNNANIVKTDNKRPPIPHGSNRDYISIHNRVVFPFI
ncbi:unnamed protein product, partial [Rotaria magnacalcarata]